MQKTISSEAHRLLQSAITDDVNAAAKEIVDAKTAFDYLESTVQRARQSGMLDKDPQALLSEMTVILRSVGGYVTEMLTNVSAASRKLAEAAKLRQIVEKSKLQHADKRFFAVLDGIPEEYSWDELHALTLGKPAEDPADIASEPGQENLREWMAKAEVGDEYKFESAGCTIEVRREI